MICLINRPALQDTFLLQQTHTNKKAFRDSPEGLMRQRMIMQSNRLII